MGEEFTSDTLYTLGHIQEYDEFGSSGILMARGGGKFIRFHKSHLFINGVKFFNERFLWQSLPIGALLKVFINLVEHSYSVGKIQTNLSALLAWTGEFPSISPYKLHMSLKIPEDYSYEWDQMENKEPYTINTPLTDIVEMSGSIYWSCGYYGLVAVRSKRDMHVVFILFDPSILYIYGQKVPKNEKLQVLCAKLTQCNMYVRPIKPQHIFGVVAEYEAVLMWRGKKPPFRLKEGSRSPHENSPAYMKPLYNTYSNSSFKQPLLSNPQRPHVNNFYPQPGHNSRFPNNDIHRQYKGLKESFYSPNYNKQVYKNIKKESEYIISNTNHKKGLQSNNYNETFSKENLSSNLNYKKQYDNGININEEYEDFEMDVSENGSFEDTEEFLNSLSINSDNELKVSYFTGPVLEAADDIAVYGGFEKASVFHRNDFYMYGEKLPTNQPLHVVLRRNYCNGIVLLHSYVSEIEITSILNYHVQWKAKYVWLGPAPPEVKESLASLSKVALNIRSLSKYLENVQTSSYFSKSSDSTIKFKSNYSSNKTVPIEPTDIEYLLSTNKESMLSNSKEDRLCFENEVRGYVLTADDNEGILTSFHDIIVFGRRKFYVNGKKFDKNGSLLEFFEGENIMVKAWIVPLESPRIVHNCVVSSRAICAWTGKPPSDLEKLKMEYSSCKKENQLPLKAVDLSLNGFYYFIGRLIDLNNETQQGILCCKKNSEIANIVFSKNSVYKHGVKLYEKASLQNYTLILGSSRWSVLAQRINPYYSREERIEFRAVAVWHFQNQNDLFDEFNQKLSLWSGLKCNCNSYKSLEEVYEGFLFIGKFFTQDDRYIVVEINHSKFDHVFVKIKKRNLWVDDCLCVFSTADEKRRCHLVCSKVGELESIHGVDIGFEAYIGWVGNKPPHIILHNTEETDNSFFDEDDSFYESGECDELGTVCAKMVNAYDPHSTDSNYDAPFPCLLKSSKQQKYKFSGKHILGHIKSLNYKYGIAEWFCGERGPILIAFDICYMFVDTVRLSQKKITSDILYERSCHLYILPILETTSPIKYNGISIQFQASVGWIGRKPPNIPGPGLQEDSDINLFNEVLIKNKEPCNSKVHICFETQVKQTQKPPVNRIPSKDVSNINDVISFEKEEMSKLSPIYQNKVSEIEGILKSSPVFPSEFKNFSEKEVSKLCPILPQEASKNLPEEFLKLSPKHLTEDIKDDNYKLSSVCMAKIKEFYEKEETPKISTTFPNKICVTSDKEEALKNSNIYQNEIFNATKNETSKLTLTNDEDYSIAMKGLVPSSLFFDVSNDEKMSKLSPNFLNDIYDVNHKKEFKNLSYIFQNDISVNPKKDEVSKLTGIQNDIFSTLGNNGVSKLSRIFSTLETSEENSYFKNIPSFIPSLTSSFKFDSQPSATESSLNEPCSPLVGEILDIHSKVGRFKGADNDYFFKSSQCFLYGANLKNVELWHVLIKGKKCVNY